MERIASHVVVQVFLLVAMLAMGQDRVPAGTAGLQVDPAEVRLAGNLDAVQLAVSAKQADGRLIDQTREASYESLSPEIARVSSTGVVRPMGNGQGRIRVSRGGEKVEVALTASGVQAKAAVSFRLDVMPIFSRAGCNGGACHGAQYGQGGFKLSLFGFAPEEDYPALVRDRQQRRVSLVRPTDSLILRKPTLEISHGGGRRFDRNSYDYEVLLRWLEADAPGPEKTR